MKKNKIFWFSVLFVLTVAFLVVYFNQNRKSYKKDFIIETDQAVGAAKSLYKESLAAGRNMQSGPCLTNDLIPGWVVDIVHDPRSPIDELPENQCAAYREGRAQHFVELDTSGNLVRVR